MVWNGQTYGYTAYVKKDPVSGVHTTYMPIWYVMQTLKEAGIQSTWNGKTWTMSTNGTVPSSAASTLNQQGNMTISLNGQISEKVPGEIKVDPLHGNKTTYMPIWYVMQILKQVGVNSDWTGSMWALYPTQSTQNQS